MITRRREAPAAGSVRMGPISIFTLVIVLCLAVLAVLSITTARADAALAARQASFTQDDYANERVAQMFAAEAADVLATLAPSTAPEDAASALAAAAPELAARTEASAPAGTTVTATIGAGTDATAGTGATAADAALVLTVAAPSGRTLTATFAVDSGAALTITSWQPATTWTEDTTDTLWMGD
ncbi:hypothetical protein [Collinsella sp. An268]|uniref:hypothetical protein n=1 Tax=Collinsella sp. An268 TaxID=1965612 RepID=UPI000B38DF87|nr:hypothetical protein [Collinsella sp. An268]